MTLTSLKTSGVGAAAPRHRPRGHRERRRHSSGGITPYLFILPFALLFLLCFLVPIAYGIYESLFRRARSGLLGGETVKVFVGLENYVRALGDADYMTSIGRVLLFGAVQVPFMIVMALVLALILDSASARWPGFFRGAYFLPYGIPGVISSILWAFLYIPGLSPIIDVAQMVGLDPDFLGKDAVLWSLANIVIWHMAGYNVLVITAQLKAISTDIYEAARIDGAGAFRQAWSIKIPLVAPAITLTALFAIIGTLQLFSEPLMLRASTGNITSTYTPNMSAYHQAFLINDYNYAAAQAVLLAVVTFVLSFGLLRTILRKESR